MVFYLKIETITPWLGRIVLPEQKKRFIGVSDA
jgi:hypothetical protein